MNYSRHSHCARTCARTEDDADGSRCSV